MSLVRASSRTCRASKGFAKTKKSPVHCSAARTEERGSFADQPLVQRGSKAGFDPPPLYIAFLLFVLLPGHALHEKGLQKQKCAGPLVSSQERRARFIPRLNHLSTAGPMRVQSGFCSSTGLHSISLVRFSEERFRTSVYDALGGSRVERRALLVL